MTAVKLSSLRADSALERAGDWVDSTSFPGVSFKVRSINYPPYTLARSMLFQKLSRRNGAKPIPQDTLFPELGRLYAQHLLLDWKGLASDDGSDLPFSADLAMETLTNPEFRDVVSAIELAAGVVGQAEIEFVEEAAKNSEVPSATN